MSNHIPQLAGMFRKELAMCNVREDESIIILRQAESRENYVEALLDAIEALGAHAEVLQIPGLKLTMYPFGGSPEHVVDVDSYVNEKPYILEFIKLADMVIDVAAEGLIHTDLRSTALENDVRMLTVREPPEVLERNMPTEGLKERMVTAKEMFMNADSLEVTSEAGTDLSVEIGEDPMTFAPYGYTDEPGRWDVFPGGFLACYPIDDSPNGRIVMGAGDVVHPMNRYLSSPIEFAIEDGFITEIEGTGAECALVESYLEMWDDEDAYETSHFGIGLNDRAVWEGLAFSAEERVGHENRGYLGGFLWSTGPNRAAGRDTRAHLDLSMRYCTVTLDGEAIVDAGKVVAPSLQP